MRQLLRNLRLAAATIGEHVTDDPISFVLLVARRLPSRIAWPAAEILSTAGRLLRSPVLSALGALTRGNPADVERATDTSRLKAKPLRDRVLADVALAAALPTATDALLARVPRSTQGLAGTRARRLWYDGEMSAAVQRLTGEAGCSTQRERLHSELSVFGGWSPTLKPVVGYVPAERTVLHLLTNSLPYTGSGYAQRSHSILSAQRVLGWNVHAVTRLGYPVQVGILRARGSDVINGVTYHRLLPGRLRRGMSGRLQQQAELLLQLCLRVRPSILHTTTHFVNGLVVQAVAEALGIPWVYEVRGQLADTWASQRGNTAKSSERYKLFKNREAQVMHQASLVITLGEAMKLRILQHGVDPAKVILCPNAVGDEFLKDPRSPSDARGQLGLPAEGVWVGTVSSLVPYEGLDNLLRAVALLVADYPGLHCLIVGDGAAAPALRALAAELNIAERIIFTGRVPRNAAHLYHQALDVFVVPRKDTEVTRAVTPLKPVEAMASCRPVVFSNLAALRELTSHGVTGIAVNPEDPVALATALSRYLDSPSLRALHGNRGRQYVLTSRTWTGVAGTIIDQYELCGAGAA